MISEDEYSPNCMNIECKELKSKLFESSFSLLSVNIRSLSCKFSEFLSHLSLVQKKFSFICITETWLTKEKDIGLEIEGYKSVSFYREGAQRGGGIKLYYLDHLNINVHFDLYDSSEACEYILVTLTSPPVGKISLLAIYRPPSSPFTVSRFLDFLAVVLNDFARDKLIILGDINLNILNNSISQDFVDLMNSFGLINEIDCPTYVLPSSGELLSCLDHIWHNLEIERNSYVISPNLSDHMPVAVVFGRNLNSEPKKIKFRDFSQGNCSRFLGALSSEFSAYTPSFDDCELFADSLINFLNRLLNKYFPLKIKTINQKRMNLPWVTGDVARCIDKKHEWYRLFRSNTITHESYRKYCKALKRVLWLAERKYYVDKFESLGQDSRRNWQILNNLLNRKSNQISDTFLIDGSEVNDGHIIADKFNEFFLSKPRNILNCISEPILDFGSLIEFNPREINFYYSTPDEVSKVITSFTKPDNIDDIPI